MSRQCAPDLLDELSIEAIRLVFQCTKVFQEGIMDRNRHIDIDRSVDMRVVIDRSIHNNLHTSVIRVDDVHEHVSHCIDHRD